MNTSLTACSSFLFAAVLLSTSAAAPADDQRSPRRELSPNRQAIIEKLEKIRFQSVTYDGLPLGEIVNNLKDECLKRDAERQGINFMLNPNAPPRPALPGEPPMETIDVGAIVIRIRPALNNVRLVDVLEAIVKVADHPLRYSIEDYGVVFSVAEPLGSRPTVGGFIFPGGTPHDFLEAVQQQYHVDWLSVADVPKAMADVRIPKLRVEPQSVGALLGGPGGEEHSPLQALVGLYNQLSQHKPELGHLVVTGDPAKPSVVMFAPDKSLGDMQPKIKVRAFSIHGLSEGEIKDLLEDINRATEEARDYSAHLRDLRGESGLRALEGNVAIHNTTGLMVATGPESYVDMVESIVNASQTKHQARRPGAPNVPATAPGK